MFAEFFFYLNIHRSHVNDSALSSRCYIGIMVIAFSFPIHSGSQGIHFSTAKIRSCEMKMHNLDFNKSSFKFNNDRGSFV